MNGEGGKIEERRIVFADTVRINHTFVIFQLNLNN
jgi:hypothetical protein